MEAQLIQDEIANHLIKKGKILKMSKYLKKWAERYLILTQNYIMTFKTQQYIDPCDVINLSYLVSVKSHFNSEEMKEQSDFSIETTACQISFRCEHSPDKWNWIVALQRLIDLRTQGDTYYNCLEDVTKKGFDSINDFNKSYPDGPAGKYFGKELTKLNEAIYRIGEKILKQNKEYKENQRNFLNDLSQERKKIQMFEALGIGESNKQYEKTCEDEQDNEEGQAPNLLKSSGSILKSSNLSSLLQGRSHNDLIQQKQSEKKQEQSTKIVKQVVTIDGQKYTKISKINLVPFTQDHQILPQQNNRKKSDHQEWQSKLKGNVNSISQIFETKIKQNQEIKRRDSETYHASASHLNDLRKSRIASGVFDQFQDISSPKKLIIFLEFIVNLLCEDECGFRDYIKLQSLNHNKRNCFVQIFLEHYLDETHEVNIAKMQKFFFLIYPSCPSLFTESQLSMLKSSFLKHLSLKNRQIREMAINNLERITSRIPFTQKQLQFIQQKKYIDYKPQSPQKSIKSQVTENQYYPQNTSLRV